MRKAFRIGAALIYSIVFAYFMVSSFPLWLSSIIPALFALSTTHLPSLIIQIGLLVFYIVGFAVNISVFILSVSGRSIHDDSTLVEAYYLVNFFMTLLVIWIVIIWVGILLSP